MVIGWEVLAADTEDGLVDGDYTEEYDTHENGDDDGHLSSICRCPCQLLSMFHRYQQLGQFESRANSA